MALELSPKNIGRNLTSEIFSKGNNIHSSNWSSGSAAKKFKTSPLKEYKSTPKKSKIISLAEVRENFSKQKSFESRSLKTGISNAKFTFMGGIGGRGRSMKSMSKMIPSPIRKGGGILAKLGMGAVAMMNVAVMKGANSRAAGMFERMMQDAAVTKNVLNNTRIGVAVGTSRMNKHSTMGLSNALSRSRHGRG